MDLKSFLSVLWRRRLVLGVSTALALIITIAGVSLITPEYVASTTLRMGTANTGSSGWVSYDIQYTDRLMNTYRTMVMSKQTSDEVMSQLNLSASPRISVTIPANTELMVISVQDKSPEQAAAAADAVANILVTQVESQYKSLGESSLDILRQQIDQTQADLAKQHADYDELLKQTPQNTQLINATLQSIQLNQSTYSSLLSQYQQLQNATAQGASKMAVVQKASVPVAPSNPNKKLIIPLGLLLGMAGGTGLAFLLENFDTTMHSSGEIAAASELPVLARIPLASRAPFSSLFAERSPQEEAFRRLRTTLFALDPEANLRSLMITSSQPSEGKSTTAANLALAVAQAGRRVIVVDGDLRKPALHRMFRVPNVVGLSSVLTRTAGLDEAVQHSMIPGVHVLTSGPSSPNPAELLGLPEMHETVEELRKQFDMVLIDTPSLQTVADAPVLSLISDAVMVVVARGLVRRESLDAALKELASIQRKPIGVVVTRAEPVVDFHYDRGSDSNSTPSGRPILTSARRAIPKLRVISTERSNKPEQRRDGGQARGEAASPVSLFKPVEPRRDAVVRQFPSVNRIDVKNGGSLECFGSDTRAANQQ